MEDKIYFASLGCFKNRVDSERLVGLAEDIGYEPVDDPEQADVCVINTCSFIEDAVKESLAAILDAAEMREDGRLKKLVVVGCLVNRYGEKDLANDIPEVDAWVRSEDHEAYASALGSSSDGSLPRRRILAGGEEHVRYLKISEGCSSRCAYCAIPSIRGAHRSLPLDQLVKEAEHLVEDGAREICIVGQDTSIYGRDLGGVDLLSLIDAIEAILPDDVWARLLYVQPRGASRELIEKIAASSRFVPYLDIPVQHSSEKILRAMNRNISRDALLSIFATARSIRPDLALRTTFMVGFPGETRDDFEDLLRFAEEVKFDRAGAFMFSPEEGTAAAAMEHQVSKSVKKRRLERLMQLQEDISLSRQSLFIHSNMSVMLDSIDGQRAEGRSFREAPEVDGSIDIELVHGRYRPGDIIRVEIKDVAEHDMEARELA